VPSEGSEEVVGVLADLGCCGVEVVVLKDLPLGNWSWLRRRVGPEPTVSRRYHAGASRQDIVDEHGVPRFLAAMGLGGP
jgi:hypothetical protein